MAAVVASVSTGQASGANYTVAVPTGTATGDLLVAVGLADPDGTTWAAPAGWTAHAPGTLAGANGDVKVWWKVAGASEATYTWTGDANSARTTTILRITGADTTSPFDVTAVSNDTVTTVSRAAPTVTATVLGLLVCGVGCHRSAGGTTNSTFTPPTGMTEQSDFRDSTTWEHASVATLQLSATGATGTKTFTISSATSAAGGGAAVSLVVKPAAGGGSNTGTLSASAPVSTASVAGTATNAASLAATAVVLAAAIAGSSSNPGTLAAVAPTSTSSITGASANPGSLAASAPTPTVSITGLTTNTAAMAASVPRATAAVVGAQVNAGSTAGTLPLLTSSTVDQTVVRGSLAATLPPLTGTTTGTATNPGTLNTTTRPLVGQVTDQSVNLGVVAGAIPRVSAAVTGVSINPGQLAAATPVARSVATGTSSNPATLLAGVPVLTSRTLDTSTAPGTLAAAVPSITAGITGTSVNAAVLAARAPLATLAITGVLTDPSGFRDVTVLSVSEIVREVAVTEVAREVAVTEQPADVAVISVAEVGRVTSLEEIARPFTAIAEGGVVNLYANAREYYQLTITTDPPVTGWDASFDNGVTWVTGEPVIRIANTWRWLVSGPGFTGDATPSAHITDTVRPIVRAADTPEVIVRRVPSIYLNH